VIRITELGQLTLGDEILWCRKLYPILKKEGRTAYDPLLAAAFPVEPIDLRYGIVIRITKKNGVLVFVTSFDEERIEREEAEEEFESDGIYGCKHWVPLNRIWLKTGEVADSYPNENNLEWAAPDLKYQQEKKQEAELLHKIKTYG
jgi:hypothetical protein